MIHITETLSLGYLLEKIICDPWTGIPIATESGYVSNYRQRLTIIADFFLFLKPAKLKQNPE